MELTLAKQDINALIGATLQLQEYRDLMERVGRGMKADVDMNFRRGHGPDGGPWAPLKVRKGQPLRDTGRLQRSITWQADATRVVIGTNLLYARLQQFGGTIKPNKGKYLVFPAGKGKMAFARSVTIPARPFIGIGKRQVDLINRIAYEWIDEKLRAIH